MRAAFNVSVGMEITAVLNCSMAMLLCDFVTAVADNKDVLDALASADGQFENGVPPEIFALATQCRRQAKVALEYKRGRRDRQEEQDEAA